MTAGNKLPEPSYKYNIPAIAFACLVIVSLVAGGISGFLKTKKTFADTKFIPLPVIPKDFGIDEIGIVVGKAVIHPHVPASYGPMITPEMLQGRTAPFFIEANVDAGGVNFEMRGSSGVFSIDQAVLRCINSWMNSPPSYVNPMDKYAFEIRFGTGGDCKVVVRSIEGVWNDTPTVFYGPSRNGRYCRKIIPMSGFRQIGVEFRGDAEQEYARLNRNFGRWCRCNANL